MNIHLTGVISSLITFIIPLEKNEQKLSKYLSSLIFDIEILQFTKNLTKQEKE